MAIDYHQQIMQDSVAQFSRLIRQRRHLDKKIARLEKMVRWGAMELSQSDPQSALPTDVPEAQTGLVGFTDAVRRVLSTYRMWLSPVLVRDLLPIVGFEIDSYEEPLPSVHVILRRLVLSGEALRSRVSSGNALYTWGSGVKESKTHTANPMTHARSGPMKLSRAENKVDLVS